MNHAARIAAVATLALAGTGCDAAPRREVAIETAPPGAHCELIRANVQLGAIDTPGRLAVRPARQDIQVVCAKAGYRDALFLIRAEGAGFEARDLLIPMAATLKSLKGDRNEYQTSTRVELVAAPER